MIIFPFILFYIYHHPGLQCNILLYCIAAVLACVRCSTVSYIVLQCNAINLNAVEFNDYRLCNTCDEIYQTAF